MAIISSAETICHIYMYLIMLQGTCEIDIYERSWENYREVTQDTCSTKKRQLGMPGGWSNVQDIPKALADNADLQKAVDMIVQRVNDMDNGLYRVVESSIVSIRQQVSCQAESGQEKKAYICSSR